MLQYRKRIGLLTGQYKVINRAELNWHGLVFDKLANGQAGCAHWSLVDTYLSVVS